MTNNNITIDNQDIDYVMLLKTLITPIIDNPETIEITSAEADGTITLSVTVAESDVGMIIGKHGKIAKAIRTLVKAASKKSGKIVNVEINNSHSQY